MAEAHRKRCENCANWHLPDLAKKRYANVGTCAALLERKSAPPWAQELSHRTKSFDGENCSAHEQKRAGND